MPREQNRLLPRRSLSVAWLGVAAAAARPRREAQTPG